MDNYNEFLMYCLAFVYCVKGQCKENKGALVLKGTGTQDLIWLKVVSLERS